VRGDVQNVADRLCQMFCGGKTLTRLGPGTVDVDVLTERCRFNGHPIGSPDITGELASWFRQELALIRNYMERGTA
jgi:hypothetical protein